MCAIVLRMEALLLVFDVDIIIARTISTGTTINTLHPNCVIVDV